MSKAITNKIKTYSTLYSVTEVDGEVPASPQLQPKRISKDGNGVAGSAEEIESDIMLPDTRIPSTPETGSESNAGDVVTEWNIDEQDDWFEGAFCGAWVTDQNNPNKKTLTLGDTVKSFSLFEKFPQTPVAWQHYRNEFVNQLTMDFATDSFVKLTWNFMGANMPKKVTNFPLTDVTPTFKPALTTKSFITKGGMWLKLGDSVNDLVALRQSPSLNITINNNLERTPALGEDESIENSLGDFVVEGSVDVYDADDKGHSIYNDAVDGKDKVLQVSVSRKVGRVTTRYTLALNVHLSAPTKSKNGNKFQFSVPFKLNDSTDLALVKEVISETDAVTPTFSETLADESVAVGVTATTLDGTATVTDGGSVTYQWYKDGNAISGATSATYTPDTTTAGSSIYKVIATNTNASATGEKTATAEQSATVTVVEASAPVFTNTFESSVTYSEGDTASELDGTATVTDGGSVTYSWTVNGTEEATTAKYTPDTTTAGEYTVVVTATNTLGTSTATSSQSVTVIVNA